MRILYQHRVASADGQFVHIEELTQCLRARGHALEMVGPKVSGVGFGTGTTMKSRIKRILPRAAFELLELGYNLPAFLRLWRAYRRVRPEVFYERYALFLLSGVLLKRLTGVPLILEVNAPLFAERRDHGGLSLVSLARWSERTVWRAADAVLPVTDALADHVRRAGVPEERILVVQNGVNEAFLADQDGASLRDGLGLQGKLVLGFVGFIREWHGLDRVIDWLARQPDRESLHLLAVGDGPALPALKRQVEALGLTGNVTFTGVLRRAALPPYVAAFDIALQPRVVDYASPLKLFEYMAAGRAIVAPAARNVREILEHERNALLFDEADPEGFGSALRRLCDEPDLRASLGAAAARHLLAREWTWAANARRVEQLAERLGAQRVAGTSAPAGRESEGRP
ncbi:MAG: glycosyltransferase family 4 protein [Tistlia sp.]|uniref:glycosyltransferase family 4 protein n=1 Tax=Tistlia sp. TaxID=3057121 RepID=UPI0034A3D136